MCTFLLQNGPLWDMDLVHCEICELGQISALIMWTIILQNVGWCFMLFTTRRDALKEGDLMQNVFRQNIEVNTIKTDKIFPMQAFFPWFIPIKHINIYFNTWDNWIVLGLLSLDHQSDFIKHCPIYSYTKIQICPGIGVDSLYTGKWKHRDSHQRG